MFKQLTDDIEIHGIAFYWLRRHLTVVTASIPLLNPLYLQRPFVGGAMMGRLEAKVCRIRVCADSQNVQISMANPRNLITRTQLVEMDVEENINYQLNAFRFRM